MRSLSCYGLSVGLLAMAVPCFAGPKTTVHGRSHIHHSLSNSKLTGSRKGHGAVAHHETAAAMPAERATDIQNALIKKGYLTGEPTGKWDPQTISAMEKLQADNGWQSKLTPDSRALIKLGLGPAPQQEHETVQAAPQ
jgi:hypothetical protein